MRSTSSTIPDYFIFGLAGYHRAEFYSRAISDAKLIAEGIQLFTTLINLEVRSRIEVSGSLDDAWHHVETWLPDILIFSPLVSFPEGYGGRLLSRIKERRCFLRQVRVAALLPARIGPTALKLHYNNESKIAFIEPTALGIARVLAACYRVQLPTAQPTA